MAAVVAVLAGVLAALGAVAQTGAVADPGAGVARVVTAAGDRPNIVVVMADDMRVDDLRFMPQLRRLMTASGLTFENAFAPFPLCCPARASFLTGLYAHNHGVYWHDAPYGYGAFDDSRTLATSLRAAGYRTGFIGKYLNGYGTMRSKVSGTPSWRYVPNGWTDWRAAFEHPDGQGIHGGTYAYFDTPFNVNGTVDNRYRGRYQTNVIGDFSVDMVDRLARGTEPFFVNVNYVAPHFGAPHESDDRDQLRDRAGRLQEFKTPARPDWVKGRFNSVVTRAAGMPRDGGPSEADISDKPLRMSRQPEPSPAERVLLRNVTRQRAESVYVMDRQVGRLVAELRRTGEWDDTVFVFTSDNGYFLGEHRRRGGKVTAHEPSLRVPLLVTGPGMRTGEKRYDPVSTVDLSATVVDLAGAAPPRVPDGSSRVPTMVEGDQGWSVPVLTESTHSSTPDRVTPGFDDVRTAIGVRTPRYSLIRNRSGQHELYDLETDPLENENVYRDPAHAAVRQELEAVWWSLKDCDGEECRVPLPDDLQASPEQEAASTAAYWRAVDRVYGW